MVKASKNKKYGWIFWVVLIIAVYVWAILGMNLSGIQSSAVEVTKSIFNGICHPDWHYVYNGKRRRLSITNHSNISDCVSWDICFSVLECAVRFLGRPVIKASSSSVKNWKVFLVFIRTFPEIVLAIMFIKAVGPGAFAGVLAVSIHSIGMLGKLFSESLENMDHGAEEAILSVGGTKSDALFLATLPDIMPQFLSYTLYRFEIAVRSASILGMVGAGGIGTPLLFAIQTRTWSRVGIILLGIVVTVTVIDWISGTLRRKLG